MFAKKYPKVGSLPAKTVAGIDYERDRIFWVLKRENYKVLVFNKEFFI